MNIEGQFDCLLTVKGERLTTYHQDEAFIKK